MGLPIVFLHLTTYFRSQLDAAFKTCSAECLPSVFRARPSENPKETITAGVARTAQQQPVEQINRANQPRRLVT